MARYNEILVGRFNRLAQKLFSMKGPANLVTLSDEMMSVFPFMNGVENRYLESFDRFGSTVAIAGAAGFVSGARFRNPAGSNVVAIIEKLSVAVGTASQINFSYGTLSTDLGTPMSTAFLDSRGRTSTAMILSETNTTATIPGGTVWFSVNPLALTQYDMVLTENQEIAVLPGQMVQMVTNNPNTLLNVALSWRERYLEDSERA